MTGRTNITDEEVSTTFADLTFLLSHGCPVIRDNVSRFLVTGSPEGKHFFVRPFVIAGKIPVADIFADALGRHARQAQDLLERGDRKPGCARREPPPATEVLGGQRVFGLPSERA